MGAADGLVKLTLGVLELGDRKRSCDRRSSTLQLQGQIPVQNVVSSCHTFSLAMRATMNQQSTANSTCTRLSTRHSAWKILLSYYSSRKATLSKATNMYHVERLTPTSSHHMDWKTNVISHVGSTPTDDAKNKEGKKLGLRRLKASPVAGNNVEYLKCNPELSSAVLYTQSLLEIFR